MKTIAELADSPEVKTAVDWWTACLTRENKQDSGDAKLNADASLIRSLGGDVRFPHGGTVQRFRLCLTVAIAAHVAKYWHEEEPDRGSACRTVATDYGPDFTLEIALAAARVEQGSLILPIKTVMWINPGQVKVACGYGAAAEIIYTREEKYREDRRG